MQNKDIKITVVIVTWNNEKDIKICLDSIYQQDYSNFEVILVDNASTDQTVKVVKENFPKVTLFILEKNIFLTGGNNFGINYALKNTKCDYVLVLNPDTKTEPNLLSVLLEIAEKDDKIGAVGPKIKFWNNTNEGLINSAGLLYDGFIQAYDIGFLQQDIGQFEETREVFGVSGTCILYKAKMLDQIGLYWDAIKMYLDEVEFFIRAHKHGWKVIYTADTTVYHNYMQSTNRNKLFNRQKQVMKAWLLIALRHYKIKSKLAMIRKYLMFKPS